jgi:hypothetical protein
MAAAVGTEAAADMEEAAAIADSAPGAGRMHPNRKEPVE